MMDTNRLYDEDFVLWSKQQVEALRAAAQSGSNQQLDWDHLAEEIEDLGRTPRVSSGVTMPRSGATFDGGAPILTRRAAVRASQA
jgi:Domain of unknown function DUF29